MLNAKTNMVHNRILVFIMYIILFYPPYFRGLYFETEAFWHLIITTLVFGFYLLYLNKGEQLHILEKPFDWVLMLFALIYLAVILVSYNQRASAGDAIRVMDYFLIYILVKVSIKNTNDGLRYIKTFFAGAAGVALVGMGAALQLLDIGWAVVDNRIYSTIQYPNTLAVFMLMAHVLGVFLILNEKNKVWKTLYLLGNYIMLTAFWGAQSRINMVLYPVIMGLLLIGLSKNLRVAAIKYIFILLFVTGVIASKIMPFSEVPVLYGRLWFVAGAAAIVFINFLLNIKTKNIFKENVSLKKPVHKFSILIVLIFILLFAVFSRDFISGIIPGDLLNKLRNISISDYSMQERFAMYQDAFKIVKEHPVMGTGGGGWKALFYKYQEHYYQINEVHSSFMDVWIETGTTGLLVFISIWVLFFYTSLKIMFSRQDAREKGLPWAVAVSALALGMHSLLDFDLSLGAMSLLLWALFGINSGLDGIYKLQSINKKPLPGAGIILLAAAVISAVFSAAFLTAEKYADAGELAYVEGNLQKAKSDFIKANRLDPLSSGYSFHIGRILGTMGEQKNDPELFKQGLIYAAEAVEKDSANADAHFLKAKFHLALGDYENTLREVELTYQYSPRNQKALNYLTKMYLAAARENIRKNNKDQAREYLTKVVAMPEKVKIMMDKLSLARKSVWAITVTPEMQQAVDEAKVLLNDI